MGERFAYQDAVAAGMKALAAVHLYVARSGLPRSLIDLVYLRASQVNGCAYCIDLHARDLRSAGVEEEKLMLVSVWREAEPFFSERERAALAWTESVTRVSETHVPDADYRDALTRFDETELANLTLAVGLINAYNRMAVSFRRGPAPPGPPGEAGQENGSSDE
ncbi:MAG TPA: carboxymuconolactone decarboxylase family protein [Longimicrobium sp.]|nr:carboxymuconolactone decarboxylase family protein [Longimicrobium sp.]